MIGLVRRVESLGNAVSTAPPYAADVAAQQLHARLRVADLHADTLLSTRDIRDASNAGHLDLPRLRAGGVGIQVLSIVTHMPLCAGRRHCGRSPNLVALLAAVAGWPMATWASDKARLLHQAAKLRAIAADPASGIVLLRTRDDLVRLTEAADRPLIGVVLAVEGALGIGDDIATVDELAYAGVRMLGLVHYCDNAVAGSAHGRSGGGLSDFGRQVVRRALGQGIIIDLAHASPATIGDVLRDVPGDACVVSHTGLRAIFDSPRNLTDAQVLDIIRAGGLLGIGAWSQALGLPGRASGEMYVDRMVQTIRHALDLADKAHPGQGQCHVALGSDFDGWVHTGFDASGWVLLTEGHARWPERSGNSCGYGWECAGPPVADAADCSTDETMMF